MQVIANNFCEKYLFEIAKEIRWKKNIQVVELL
jgi:hypothetical protein